MTCRKFWVMDWFLGDWMGDELAPPSSIYRVDPWDEICPSSKDLTSKFLIIEGCNDFLLLRPVEEVEKKDESDCWASWYSGVRSSWISLCDKTLLSGRIGRILTSTWSVRLVSDQIRLALQLAFEVLGSTYEEGVGFVRAIMAVIPIRWSSFMSDSFL